MKSLKPLQFLTVSSLALALSLGSVAAQQAVPAANDNSVPLSEQPAVETPGSPLGQFTFANLVEQVSPAVVNITTSATVSTPARGSPLVPEGSPFSDLFRDFGMPNIPGTPNRPPREQRSNALGSGFVISPDGYIVTNNHVIDGADQIEIEFKDGSREKATVVGTDPNTDIALLKVATTGDIPYVAFGDSDQSRVGDWVLALGNPLGQGFSASTGIVSARGRALTGTYDDFIQTDAAINRGNSGGPLFNMNGEVIGVNTAILSPNGGSIGIGFSMASNVVTKVVDQLREFGETRRGWLGVKIQDLTPDMADALGLPDARGAMVSDVPAGPAMDAGMKTGDVIRDFAGVQIQDTRDLIRRVADAPVGKAVDVTVWRDGQNESLQITLGRRETAEGGAATTPDSTPGEVQNGAVLGMTLTPLTPDLAQQMELDPAQTGLVVQEVDPSSGAAEKGLLAGDLITEAGQQPVTSVADLQARVSEAKEAGRKSVLVLVRRGGEPHFLALPVDG